MTFSSLISGTIPHHNKYNARPGKVTRVIQHHWADVTMSGERSLASPGRKASVNYLVHNDGVIIGQVPEEFRPWTSGGPTADNPSITIECQNSTAGPEWAVSDAAFNSIVRLLADIAARHGFGSLTTTNYRGHRGFAATACPGPYLWPRLQSIRDAANALRGGTILAGSHSGVPVPVRVPVSTPAPAPAPRPSGLTVDGIFGPATKAALQRAVGVAADSIVGRATIGALQRHVGAAHDGIWGPLTTRALQRHLGVTVDGIAGPQTYRALQQRLNAHTF